MVYIRTIEQCSSFKVTDGIALHWMISNFEEKMSTNNHNIDSSCLKDIILIPICYLVKMLIYLPQMLKTEGVGWLGP